MNEQLDYRIVQFLGPGEADRPSLQPFETRPEVEIMPLDLQRSAFAHRVTYLWSVSLDQQKQTCLFKSHFRLGNPGGYKRPPLDDHRPALCRFSDQLLRSGDNLNGASSSLLGIQARATG